MMLTSQRTKYLFQVIVRLNRKRFGCVLAASRSTQCPKTGPLSSAAGCDSYETLKREFESAKVPERYNFARDVVDKWAAQPKVILLLQYSNS